MKQRKPRLPTLSSFRLSRSGNHRLVLHTDNIHIFVVKKLSESNLYYITCTHVSLHAEEVTADSIEEASKLALKRVADRLSWMTKLWRRELRQMTEQTKQYIKELETSRCFSKN